MNEGGGASISNASAGHLSNTDRRHNTRVSGADAHATVTYMYK